MFYIRMSRHINNTIIRIQLKTTNYYMFTEYTQRAQTVGDEAKKIDRDRENCRH